MAKKPLVVITILICGIIFLLGCTQIQETPESQKNVVEEPVLEKSQPPTQEALPGIEVQEENEVPVVPTRINGETVDERSVEVKEEREERTPASASTLINGKTVEERLAEAVEKLHAPGSEDHIRKNFPDIELIYTDPGDPIFPKEILPFRYYYSKEADTTFNICKPRLTIFICKGKVEQKITKEDYDSGKCTVTPLYLMALGGGFGYKYG